VAVKVAKARTSVPGQLGALGPVALTEKAFQKLVRDLARRLGWDLVFHAMQPFHAAERGWPDLVLVRTRDRRLIFAELKAERGKLADRQVEVLAMLRSLAMKPHAPRADGHWLWPAVEVHVWRPSDYESIVEVLR
jgi:hypothetical protein